MAAILLAAGSNRSTPVFRDRPRGVLSDASPSTRCFERRAWARHERQFYDAVRHVARASVHTSSRPAAQRPAPRASPTLYFALRADHFIAKVSAGRARLDLETTALRREIAKREVSEIV